MSKTPDDNIPSRPDETVDDVTQREDGTSETLDHPSKDSLPGTRDDSNQSVHNSPPPTSPEDATVSITGEFRAKSPTKISEPATPNPSDPSSNTQEPTAYPIDQFSGYETLEKLGEGSFGVVLKCRDTKLDRLVAIKFQKGKKRASSGKIDRFLAEARAAGQLRHPNIVPVYEFGESDGNPFIVYAFVDGQTLNHWAEDQPNLNAQIELIAQIADALDYAHSLGIIHRDIKPANILVDNRLRQPHIADFGCAKLEQPDMLETVDGSIMGTPAYMSPEVCEGFANQADGRADQWALGVMLYELLTGERPFRGKYAELFHKIRHQEPTRLRAINPAIPEDLETITLKCLEKDKQRRYESCQTLANDLRHWLTGRPITARRVGSVERTWLWSKRNPTLASLVGVVAACLIFITVGSLIFSIISDRQKNEIVNKQKQLAQTHLDSLESAAPATLPTLIEDLASLDPESIVHVQQKLAEVSQNRSAQFPLKLALYRLESLSGKTDAAAIQDLALFVKTGDPQYHSVLLEVAGHDMPQANPTLWDVALNPEWETTARVSACALLASTDPGSQNWDQVALMVIEYLLAEEQLERAMQWCELLRPAATHFGETTRQLFESQDDSVRERSAQIAARLYQDDLPLLITLGKTSTPEQIRCFKHALRKFEASEIASQIDKKTSIGLPPAAHANLLLMQLVGASPQSPNPSETATLLARDNPTLPREVRSYLVNYCGIAGVDVDQITQPIRASANDVRKKRSSNPGSTEHHDIANLILALGSYDKRQYSTTERATIQPDLVTLFCFHPDSSVHSASRWLLQQWGLEVALADCLKSIQSELPKPGYGWHEDPSGICFAVFEPTEFHYGPDDEYPFSKNQNMTSRQEMIGRRFGVAIYETTRQDFSRVENLLAKALATQADSLTGESAEQALKRSEQLIRNQKNRMASEREERPTEDAPVASVSWDEVTLYCNALNRIAGIASSQNVYSIYGNTNQTNPRSFGKENGLELSGYRLPTAQEWEFAARGDASHRFCFGNDIHIFEAYGWSVNNSHNIRQSVGRLKPNDHGLFDVHGNVAEWCHNDFVSDDSNDAKRQPREIRGQSAAEETRDMTLFYRDNRQPLKFSKRLGFRIARTYPPHEP